MEGSSSEAVAFAGRHLDANLIGGASGSKVGKRCSPESDGRYYFSYGSHKSATSGVRVAYKKCRAGNVTYVGGGGAQLVPDFWKQKYKQRKKPVIPSNENVVSVDLCNGSLGKEETHSEFCRQVKAC
jgi:hypothetical protein